VSVEFIHDHHDAILEFLLGCDTDVAQHGAGELGEETLDQIEPGAVLGREDEFESTNGLLCKPSFGFLRDVCGMIIEDKLDRSMGWIGGIDELEEFDEFAVAVPVLGQGDRDLIVGSCLLPRSFLDELHLAIDAQNLPHLLL
jgi:hypothetical protein